MRRASLTMGLLLALALAFNGFEQPAWALPAQRVAALSGAPCGGAVLSLNFSARVFCGGGISTTNPEALPGWSFSRASTGTAVDSAGAIISFAPGVPRITDLGILIEESRTNSFLDSAIGATQSVTTTAASWTLSFYGTGSITLTGGATGTLAGTGANSRVSMTVTATAASTILTVTGSVTKVQFEAGAFATSYIPTTIAAATRAADVASISGLVLPSTGYTMLAEYLVPTQTTGYHNLFTVWDGTSNNRADIGSLNVSSYHAMTVGGVQQADYNSTFSTPVNTVIKSGFSVTAGRQIPSVNGSITTPQAGASLNSGVRSALLGDDAFGRFANGYLKQIAIYPVAYTDAQLQTLTR